MLHREYTEINDDDEIDDVTAGEIEERLAAEFYETVRAEAEAEQDRLS
ncbi:hypothetical protein [Amycolatopsis sp. YIM 10]|nr:hypothetical protein [Amycolatopsis sp. YIM 10]